MDKKLNFWNCSCPHCVGHEYTEESVELSPDMRPRDLTGVAKTRVLPPTRISRPTSPLRLVTPAPQSRLTEHTVEELFFRLDEVTGLLRAQKPAPKAPSHQPAFRHFVNSLLLTALIGLVLGAASAVFAEPDTSEQQLDAAVARIEARMLETEEIATASLNPTP